MKYLPFDSITYRTKLKEEEVKKRLADNIALVNFLGFRISDADYAKPYKGTIEGNSFTIRRRIQYRNSFVPRIHGVIESDFVETVIRVKMRLSIYVMIFMTFWCSVVAIAALGVSIVGFAKHSFDPVAFIPWGMLLAAYLMTILGFNREKKIAKADWQRIFEAEIVN
jgi:hypothetical protein